MNISTLLYFISHVSEGNFEDNVLIEDVSISSYPEIIDYLNHEEANLRESVVQNILSKIKA